MAEDKVETDFELMAAIITEEVGARLAIDDFPRDVHDNDWLQRIGELAADALLRAFAVRRIDRSAVDPPEDGAGTT